MRQIISATSAGVEFLAFHIGFNVLFSLDNRNYVFLCMSKVTYVEMNVFIRFSLLKMKVTLKVESGTEN